MRDIVKAYTTFSTLLAVPTFIIIFFFTQRLGTHLKLSNDIDFLSPDEHYKVEETPSRNAPVGHTKRLNHIRPAGVLGCTEDTITFKRKRRIFDFIDFTEPMSKDHDDFNCLKTSTYPPFTVCIYRTKKDVWISNMLVSKGVWEPHVTRLVTAAMVTYPQSVFIDVGANIGYFTLLAASLGHHVLAVEPAVENIDRFRKAVYVDRLWDRIVLVQNAISNEYTRVEMSKNLNNQGNLYMVKKSSGNRTIRTVTLSDLSYLVNATVAILKIDIEGYECRAFQRASLLFSKVYIPYIFMEWVFAQHFVHDKNVCNEQDVRSLTAFLLALGYLPYNAASPSLEPLNPVDSLTGWMRKTSDILWAHNASRYFEVRSTEKVSVV